MCDDPKQASGPGLQGGAASRAKKGYACKHVRDSLRFQCMQKLRLTVLKGELCLWAVPKLLISRCANLPMLGQNECLQVLASIT